MAVRAEDAGQDAGEGSSADDTAEGTAGPKRRGVARSASLVGAAVMLSRVLGLVREQVFAFLFGGGQVMSAFVIAFRVPNLFRDLLAEGALSAAFVKTFSQRLDRAGEAPAFRLAAMVLNAIAIGVGLFVFVGVLAAPWIVSWMAPEYEGEQASLTILLTRTMFPYLLLVALAAVAMGALNALGAFGAPALHSAFFNVFSVVGGLASVAWLAPGFVSSAWKALVSGVPFEPSVDDQVQAIFGMALGVVLGGMAQCGWQLRGLRRRGYRHQLVLDRDDQGLRDVFRLMAPAVLGAAAVQVNVVVNTVFASTLESGVDAREGSVASLNFAFRLMQLPIGIFGVAIATATLPAIARAMARDDRADYRSTLSSSIRLALFLTVPSAVGLVVLSRPIIQLIYEHGAFDADATHMTGAALACYAPGLVGYSLVKILAPAFFALDDAKTPAQISAATIVVNVLLCWALIGPLGVRGLALSTAVVATVNAALLFLLLRRRFGPVDGRRIGDGAVRVAIASAALGIAAFWAHDYLSGWLPGERLVDRAVRVALSIGAGAVVYLVSAVLLRIEEVDRVRRLLVRRRS